MKLIDLKIACYLFNQFSNYDEKYQELKNKYPFLKLNDEEHVKALINWLRSWGCRQFKVENEDLSIKSIMDWYKLNETDLPKITDNLIDYNLVKNDKLIINIFHDLKKKIVAYRESKNNKFPVTIGAVGTAKALFALRPNLFAPWDNPIFKKLELKGDGHGYLGYLKKVQEELEGLRKSLELTEEDWFNIFKTLDKEHKSHPKLVDEYFWITITKKCDLSKFKDFFNYE